MIDIATKGIGKTIARQPVNATTLAMLEQLNEVIENAKYIASEPSNKVNRSILRTDRFETDLLAGGKPGVARMRINVTPQGNKLYFATNEMTGGSTPQPSGGISRQPGIEGETPVIDINIPQTVNDVKRQAETQVITGLLPGQSELAAARGYPQRIEGATYKAVEIPQSKIDEISAYIDRLSNAEAKKKYKQILKNLFMGRKFTNVNTIVNELNYQIGIGSKGIGEIIARQPVNAERSLCWSG